MSENTNDEGKSPVLEITNENGNNQSRFASLLPGFFLILLGLYFLARNITGFYLDNWWALFILIPAVNNFSNAMSAMRRDGNLSRSARGYFFRSLIFVLLVAAFLLSIEFGLIWPIFIILAGLGVLLGVF